MNNNIYIFIGFILVIVISNIIVYNIGIKNGKNIYKNNMKTKCLEGIKKAKSEGKYKGGKFKKLPDNHAEVINRWVNNEIDSVQAAKELNISKSTLYRRFGNMKKKTL